MLAVIAQASLIFPVNLHIFFLGPSLDLRIGFFQPALHCFGILFIGALYRLLRGETPTLEILADSANRHSNTGFLPDQLHDGLARPQGVGHLQLIWRLVHDLLANRFLLIRREMPALSSLAATPVDLELLLAEF